MKMPSLIDIIEGRYNEVNSIVDEAYKWKPSASQRREFAEKMKDPAQHAAYIQRKNDRADKKREGSKFNYSTAGGNYIPTRNQADFVSKHMELFKTPQEIDAANMVLYGYDANEKVHHDNIHIVNDKMRNMTVESKTYSFYKKDGDKTAVQIDAEDDDEADEKIKQITGQDPKKITKWSEDDDIDENLLSLTNIYNHINELEDEGEEEICEDNTTSSLDGGEGMQQTPNAFRRKVKKPSDTTYCEPVNEVAYKEWVNDATMSPKQKINKAILEVARNLYEVDRLISRSAKLKTEINADQSIYWKNTVNKFTKINERLLKISSKIRNISQ